MAKPRQSALFSRVSVKDNPKSSRSGINFFDVMLGLVVGFILTASGMHMLHQMERLPPPEQAVLSPDELQRQQPTVGDKPHLDGLGYMGDAADAALTASLLKGHAQAPGKPTQARARNARELPEHEVRYDVDITSVETNPVEKIDITLPGAGGNQLCAEGGANILPGWVCVKRHRLERRPTITPEELLDRYYKQAIPVILTDFFVREWKVFKEDAWAPLKLKERFGDVDINVQMGRESDPDFEIHQHLLRKDIKFGDYIDMVLEGGESNDYYITANNYMLKRPELKGMIDDIQPFFPGFMNQKGIGSGTYYWLGPKGTITPLHQDATSLFHVHIKGRKLWRFISPDQKAMLYNNYGVYSEVDLLLPWEELLAKYPLMEDVTVITEILQPGETVFIPNGWFHHVIGLDHPVTSMSTTVWEPDFRKQEHEVHKRWNSLYKPQQPGEQKDRQNMVPKLKKFIADAWVLDAEKEDKLKKEINEVVKVFREETNGGSLKANFLPAKKKFYGFFNDHEEARGALMYVLAGDHNKMPSEWKGWVMLNISRRPPLETITQVMMDSMNEMPDTFGVVDSWMFFLKSGENLKVGHQ